MKKPLLCLAALAALAIAQALPAHAAEAVLTGKVKDTARVGSAGASGAHGSAAGAGPSAAAGAVITFTIDSFTTDEQVAQLEAATDLASFLNTLATFRAGSMTAKGEGSIPINAAFKDASGNYVLLSTSDPRTLAGSTYSATGRAVGMARLMPSRAEGWLASTTQVVAFSGGTPVARAGSSQATSLVEVTEK
jgi:hypothetical protein